MTKKVTSQSTFSLQTVIKNVYVILLLCLFVSCNSQKTDQNGSQDTLAEGLHRQLRPSADLYQGRIIIQKSEKEVYKLTAFAAITPTRQRLGLSGLKTQDFDENWAMLFPAHKKTERQFWMPNTFFPLDIIFIDENWKIVDIHRQLAPYSGALNKSSEKSIPKSKVVFCQHVLEIRSDSPMAEKFQIGDQLIWQGKKFPWEK